MRILEEALTFDDVLLVPAHSSIMPKDVDLTTRVTRDIELKVPLLSAAMDTVTEARLSIALAQEGGLGIIHKNLTAEQQAEQRHQNGVRRTQTVNAVAFDVFRIDVIDFDLGAGVHAGMNQGLGQRLDLERRLDLDHEPRSLAIAARRSCSASGTRAISRGAGRHTRSGCA